MRGIERCNTTRKLQIRTRNPVRKTLALKLLCRASPVKFILREMQYPRRQDAFLENPGSAGSGRPTKVYACSLEVDYLARCMPRNTRQYHKTCIAQRWPWPQESLIAGSRSGRADVDDRAGIGTVSLPFSRPKKPAARPTKRIRESYIILCPASDRKAVPLPTEAPVPALKLYRNYKCTRCDHVLPKGKRVRESTATHFNQHRLVARRPDRQPKQFEVADIPGEKGTMVVEPNGQWFFVQGCQSSFFIVHVASEVGEPDY